MKKNDVIILEITAMSSDGYGIGRYENIPVFVPLTAIGDKVRVLLVKDKKAYFFGKLIEIIEKSGDRQENNCTAFEKCGGCVYRHITYEAECKIKYQKVYDAVRRIGKMDLKPESIVSGNSYDTYRNKVQLPFDSEKNFGFFAVHSHRVVKIDKCYLQPEIFNEIADAFSDFLRRNNISTYDEISKSGLIRHLYLRCSARQSQIMVVIVINGDSIPHTDELLRILKDTAGETLKSVQLNINKEDTNVILGEKCKVIYGSETITDELLGVKFSISPLSFYQVNHDMTEKLYKKAISLGNIEGKLVLDLYCGAGTIGLCAAEKAKKVIGVEIIKDAIKNAKHNAELNNIKNAEFYCGDAKTVAADLNNKNLKPDVVFLDPPRKGLSEELIETVSDGFSPERIVYVSCDPATLARDLTHFYRKGYVLIEYTPFDLFPRTKHIETVALLMKQSN